MSTHSESHCRKPSLMFKQEGTIWRCTCGQYWCVTKNSDYFSGRVKKYWTNVTAHYRDENIKELERRQDSYQRSVDALRRDYDDWTKKVFEAFDQASKDVQELQARIIALETKKVTRGKSASQ